MTPNMEPTNILLSSFFSYGIKKEFKPYYPKGESETPYLKT